MLLGNATADCWTPYNGGLKVVMGCKVTDTRRCASEKIRTCS